MRPGAGSRWGPLELVTDEPPRRLALLQRNIEKFGTVSGTLGLAAEVVGELVAVEALND